MSSEELRDLLFQNWTGTMSGVSQIHDSYDFTVPDFIASDKSFMEVFNEVLHDNHTARTSTRTVDRRGGMGNVARKTTSKSKKAVAKDAEPVYVWGVQSSKPRGGQFITYEVRLEENGEIRCNCPSWIFKKAKAERGCKHSHSVEDEAKKFFQMFKKGEQLPTVAMTPEQTQRLLSNPKKTESDIGRFGRVLEID